MCLFKAEQSRVFSTSVEWSGIDFVKKLSGELESVNPSYQLMDYSIQPLKNVQDSNFKYSTSISLIINQSLKQHIIESIIIKSFESIGVNSIGNEYYINNEL